MISPDILAGLYTDGLRNKDLAAAAGCSIPTAYRHLRRAGVEVGPQGRPPTVNRKRVIRLVENALDWGHTKTEAVRYAAVLTGCGPATVWRAIRGEEII